MRWGVCEGAQPEIVIIMKTGITAVILNLPQVDEESPTCPTTEILRHCEHAEGGRGNLC